jgi:hypothetical protein
MFDPEKIPDLKKAIRERTEQDRKLLDELRAEVKPLASKVRAIKPRGTTSVSLVASDGGNNKLVFDPFTIQLVRVVDSDGKELCFDVISPTTDTDKLSEAQFNPDGTAKTKLGQLMLDLGVKKLDKLSHMIPDGKKTREKPNEVSPSWVLVYRDLCEWAVLYDRIVHGRFDSNTLIVRDGQLRSKLFRGELFSEMRKKMEEAITRVQKEDKKSVFLVGIAKHSKVYLRYQLAVAIENVLPPGDARYVKIPREIEAKAYVWPEYAKGAEAEGGEGEAPKFVAGDMYFVRFGGAKGDPVWAVDIFSSQAVKDAEVFGYLLADAIDGFPVPLYPRCLQRAHEHAQVVDFDLAILQDEVFTAVRGLVPDGTVLDEFQLNVNASARRYE